MLTPQFLAFGAAHIDPSPLWAMPFATLLALVAVGPLAFPHFWHRHYPKFALGLGAVVVGYYAFWLKAFDALAHAGTEYASFIALIGSLFVVAGGIHIKVKGEATPVSNVVFLFVGAVLANVLGTTGAAMLLIRPWIRMNRYRVTAFHIVFFIFIVANVGGSLTPIGDPPLFLGFLRGVEFWWVIQHCFAGWAVAVGCLLAIFYFLDRRNFLKAPKAVREKETTHEEWEFLGAHNVLFLAAVVGSVFVASPPGLREVLMVGAAAASYWTTPKRVHEANAFSFAPIKEVAWLFLGIFATMMPALAWVEGHAGELHLETDMHFYFVTGLLSAVLDNAPTYLTFLAAAFGLDHLSLDRPSDVPLFLVGHTQTLVAISLGAVFFGAMTYIGNGPNFMVKAIAAHANVKTPTFFGYVFRYSLPFLFPVLVLVAVLHFSPWRVF